MIAHVKIAVALFMGLLALVKGQATYWTADQVATPAWTKGGSPVNAGNGAFISPDGKVLAVVGVDGSVRAFKPDGSEMWTYEPADLQTSSSFGGAFFSSYNGQSYVLYSLVTNALFKDKATSQLIALKTSDGSVLFESKAINGVAKGTPVTTSDGSLLITTHNVGGSKGFVSIFQFGNPAPNLTYTPPATGNSTFPFGAVGYFWNPTEGNYPEGAGNPNDIFIWAFDTPEGATEVVDNAGQMFVFQKPFNPLLAGNFTVYKLGDTTSFFTPNPPVLTNNGYSLYWSITQSQIRYWQGDGLPRNYFANNFVESVGFERGTPRFVAAAAPVTLSSDPVQPIVYGPSASTEIFRMPYDLSDKSVVSNTSEPLTNKVLISPDNMYIYYADKSGILYQLNAANLNVVWSVTIGTPVMGELAQSPDGSFIYVADTAGGIRAYQVADKVAVDSMAPTASLGTPVPSPYVSDLGSVESLPTSEPVDDTETEGSAKPTAAPASASPRSCVFSLTTLLAFFATSVFV